MADRAALFKRWLVDVLFLVLLGLIRVAGEARIHRIRLHKSRGLARMRIVAVGAIARRARMLHFGRSNLFRLLIVAGDAQVFRAGCRQNHLASHSRLMAALAHLVFEWIVRERLQQLGRPGLVRIMALNAIRSGKWLILVRLLQARVFGIVAIDAQRRSRFRQMKIKFRLAALARLVRHVAGLASHVEGCVPATFIWNVQPGVVAAQAEILFLATRGRLEQLILVVAGVRVVALHAIANCRAVNLALDVSRILVRMAGHAEAVGRGRDQLDPRYLFIHANFVAAQAAHLDRGVNRLSLGFVFVALETLLRVSVWLERDGVGRSKSRSCDDEDCYGEQQHREVGNSRLLCHRLPILSCERHLA